MTLLTNAGTPRLRRARTFAVGKRRGRPPKPGARLRHRARAALARRYPVHVTWRVVPGLPNLRSPSCMRALRRHLGRGKERFGFRLVHFSVQRNHLHLLCEAEDARSLARGLQGLAVRLAKGLNRSWERKGKVFADRYHNRILTTPSEVRWALGYVLCNARRHDAQLVSPRRYPRRWIDAGCSSAPHFGGFHHRGRLVPCLEVTDGCSVVAPRTWLLHRGWLGLGKLATDHVPGPRAG